MKVDLSEKLLSLEGDELFEGQSAGRVLARYLMDISTKEPLMVFKVAMALLDDKEIELNKEEYNLIHTIVKTGNLSNLLKARILTQLEKGKDA